MTIPSTVSDVAPTNGKLKSDRSAYLQQLLSLRPALDESAGWVKEIRDRATARVQELAIPSNRDEEWRFTDLSSLLEDKFISETRSCTALQFSPTPLALPEALESQLTFVNGVYTPELSKTANLPSGVIVSSLAELSSEEIERIKQRLAQIEGSQEVFTALNTASVTDVAVVWVSKNVVVTSPIHLQFVSNIEPNLFISPRCLVVAESGSNLTLVEEYTTTTGEIGSLLKEKPEYIGFTNAVTEIWLDENAQIIHTRVQREYRSDFHIGKTAVSQARDSRYTCNAVSLGAKLSRHNLEVYHTGEQTETTLNGLTMISGEQVADTHSTIAYAHPHGSSNQIHKCIVDDRAHAIFNGKVFVPKAAQLTNAKQLSSNLLLSPKARVDTKPQLEITADNVKCTHGATVSQLDSDEVFYLQSRGIDEDSARKLLTYAFAYEVIQKIPVASLREKLVAIVRSQPT